MRKESLQTCPKAYAFIFEGNRINICNLNECYKCHTSIKHLRHAIKRSRVHVLVLQINKRMKRLDLYF